MIKMKAKLIAICIILTGSHTIDAQSQQPRATLGLGFGFSNVLELKYDTYPSSFLDWSQHPFNGLLESWNNAWSVERTPAVAINLDMKINKHFAFGLGLTYDRGFFTYLEEGRSPANGYIGGWLSSFPRYDTILHYSVDFSRLNLGIRGLCYIYSGEKSELYTGIRGGLTQYHFISDIYVCNILPSNPIPSGKVNRIQLQLILLGWNVNLHKDFLLQFEMAVGQPYSLAMNLGYRL
jgi:hypothetical protein